MNTSAFASTGLGSSSPLSVNPITRQPLTHLTRMMRLANRVNACLLVVTGVLGLFSAFGGSALTMVSSIMLSIYVAGFGALLAKYEFASNEALRQDHGYMYTYAGRAAFLLLSGNLAWTCAPLGFPTAVLTNANAIFSAYVMWAHPAFVEGQVSRTSIGSVDGDDAGAAAGGSAGFAFAADPASDAARQQAIW